MKKSYSFDIFNKFFEITVTNKDDSKLLKLRSDKSVYFIADLESKLYHEKNCCWLDMIPEESIQECGRYPEKKGFISCQDCKPFSGYYRILELDKQAKEYYLMKKQDSKAEIIGKALEKICQGFGFHGKAYGGVIDVTTALGEWYFMYNDKPIKLRHKNNRRGLGYHIQHPSFESPVDALIYIRNHEYDNIERAIKRIGTE